jgi:hypothetical protein
MHCLAMPVRAVDCQPFVERDERRIHRVDGEPLQISPAVTECLAGATDYYWKASDGEAGPSRRQRRGGSGGQRPETIIIG